MQKGVIKSKLYFPLQLLDVLATGISTDTNFKQIRWFSSAEPQSLPSTFTIGQILARCRNLGANCQQSSDASNNALKLFQDSPFEPLQHKFQNMYDMLSAKVDRLAGNIDFAQKNT